VIKPSNVAKQEYLRMADRKIKLAGIRVEYPEPSEGENETVTVLLRFFGRPLINLGRNRYPAIHALHFSTPITGIRFN